MGPTGRSRLRAAEISQVNIQLKIIKYKKAVLLNSGAVQ